MNTITRSFLCIGLLITSFSVESAYKAAKFTAAGAGLGATLYAADLMRNYIKYPHPNLAKSATYKDIDDLTSPSKKFLASFHAELAKSKTFQDFEIEKEALTEPVKKFLAEYVTPAHDAAAKNLDEAASTGLTLLQPMAAKIHLQLYPRKEDCPCIKGFEACAAHKVNFGEAILIKAATIIAQKKQPTDSK